MPNTRPTPGLRLTPERREQIERRVQRSLMSLADPDEDSPTPEWPDVYAEDAGDLLHDLDVLEHEVERLRGALNISPDDVGRIMHESWSRTKRSQGFHHPSECPNGRWVETARGRAPCPKCHADLIPWDNLPEPQKDINRHAFDDVLAEIRRRAALAERGGEG